MTVLVSDPPRANWTVTLVEERLTAAAATMRCIPAVKAPGYYNVWPEIIRDRFEAADIRDEPKSSAATPRQMTEMEDALGWLRCLSPEDQKLVWSRAEGKPWKAIAAERRIHRATAHNRHRCALSIITGMLNSTEEMSRHR